MADSNAFAYAYPNPGNRAGRLVCKDFRHKMAPFQHDLVIAQIQGATDTNPALWDTGTPIQFTYGRTPAQTANFYGYLVRTSRAWQQNVKTSISGLNRMMEVHAIGASFVFKQGIQGVWEQSTSAQIAASIAAQRYFSFDAQDNGYIWPAYHISASTDWKALCELAKRTGQVLCVNNTHVRFTDPTIALTRNNTYVPTFYEKDSGIGETVLSFTTDNTEIPSEAGRRKRLRVAQSTDINTGQATYTSSDPTTASPPLAKRTTEPWFTEYEADLVTRTQADSDALLGAKQVENRFYIRAKASLSGDPRVVQESPVIIEGVGARNSGVWQALTVEHHVGWQWFSTEVELGRDSDYDNGARPGVQSTRPPASTNSAGQQVVVQPNTILVNGRWRAAYGAVGAR